MRRPGLVFAAIVVTVAFAALVLFRPIVGPACTTVAGAPTVGVLVANLPNGTAKFFCYRTSAGDRLRFILARDDHGQVHAVFDACSQCYRFHKGYAVADGYLICRLCGNRYKLDHLREGIASCVPVHLDSAIRGGRVEIKVADLTRGRTLF